MWLLWGTQGRGGDRIFSSSPQVIQQALSRQPSTAAQYLQQMYAAQQQHLMLQSAALQHQQHLNSTHLQSLAAAQQVSVPTGAESGGAGRSIIREEGLWY